MRHLSQWRVFVSLYLYIWAFGIVSATAEEAGVFKVSEVHGVKTRSGRQLQQAFGSSSIVPLVIDDSPCVSFNADDASPVLDSNGNIVGYTTVHSNSYDAAGLSILRLDVVILNFEINYYFGAVNGSNLTTNVRATLSTGLPNACPSTTPALLSYSQGIYVDCAKRRATLDMSVPTSLFNCTTATTEDFSIVFFLQLEVELAPQQCAVSKKPFYAGGVYNTIPYGSGCSYVMVTAACKPSTCVVDTSSLGEEEQLNQALGSTGRIAGPRAQRASSAYNTGMSGVNAAVVGGLVGGVLLAAAVVIAYVLFIRRGAVATAHHGRRSHSVASDYLDADRYDSFTIDTTSVTGARHQREARRASRASMSGRLSMSGPSGLLAMGAGRWRDKFGTAPAAPEAGGSSAGGAAPPSVTGDSDGNQLLKHAQYTPSAAAAVAVAASTGGSMSIVGSPFAISNARLPSMFFSARAPSVFAQPRQPSMVGPSHMPAPPIIQGRLNTSMSRGRRSSTLATAPTVPMVLDRAFTSNLGVGSPSDGSSMATDLAYPNDVSSVFLNPLALLRGSRTKDRSGSSSPRLLSMSTLTSAFNGLGSATVRRTPPRGAMAVAAEDRSDGPLIRMIVEEEAQGGGSSDGSTRHHLGPVAGSGNDGAEALTSLRTQPPSSRRGGASGGPRPGPVAESTVGAGEGAPQAGGVDVVRWPNQFVESAGQPSGVMVGERSPASSTAGSVTHSPGEAGGTRSLAGSSLRSILPRPPPLVLPTPIDAAAVAAASHSARLSRPFNDARASLASSSRGSSRSLHSQVSWRSMQAQSPGGTADT